VAYALVDLRNADRRELDSINVGRIRPVPLSVIDAFIDRRLAAD
jgi:hypothetical protein